jgi:hypothetical protein
MYISYLDCLYDITDCELTMKIRIRAQLWAQCDFECSYVLVAVTSNSPIL